MKKWILPVFILLALVQWLVPGKMIVDRENIVHKGKAYRFLTEPVDPANPFIGKYMVLNFKQAIFTANKTAYFESGQTIFALLQTDAAGFAKVTGLTTKEPSATTTYVKATVLYITETDAGKEVHLDYPFDKFFMEEYKAPKAEDLYRKANTDTTKKTYALVKIWKGRAVTENLIIDNKSILELIP
jgi:uncharacterized membrane-anchored protein